MKNTSKIKTLSEAIREGVKNVFEEYEFDSEELSGDSNYDDGENIEAEISTALSFMQDLQGSRDKLEAQKEMQALTPIVKTRLDRSINHMNKAIDSYLSGLSDEVRDSVERRLSEMGI